MAIAKRDDNHVPTLVGVSSVDNTTITLAAVDPVTGRLLVDSVTGITVYTETPTGTIDGVNKAFTTVHTITTVLGLYLNGQYQHPTTDYTATGTTITFVTAPDISLSGTPFTVTYI